ncbi:MAG: hypothetical protein IJM37_03745 [Lachnospiraceae bacterium]|nr:hypothetical protein [Lachnospiraceae bacterium]
MKKNMIRTFLFSLLLLFTACSDNIDIDNNTKGKEPYIDLPTETIFTQTVEGIEFTVEFDKSWYTLGDDIEVIATAKNVTGSDILVWSDTRMFGKNGAVNISTYVDGVHDYISNDRDYLRADAEYEGVLENLESISCNMTFYTDTVKDLTAKNDIEFCVYLGIKDDIGSRGTVSIMIPVKLIFDN